MKNNKLGVYIVASALLYAPFSYAQQVSIATGGTGGVYYPVGGGMAQMITDNMPGVSAVAEVTGAAAEKMGPRIRAMASVYPGALHLVTLAGSQVHSLDDLKGKRVSVGGPGSGTELHAKIALEANGITFDDFSAQRLNFNETADAIRDGDVDAGFIASVLPPTSSIMSLATTRDISLISLSDDEVANIQKVEPVFASYELMPGVY